MPIKPQEQAIIYLMMIALIVMFAWQAGIAAHHLAIR